MVEGAINALDIGTTEVGRIPELELVLVDLQNVDRIRSDAYLTRYAEAIMQAERPGDTPLPLDGLDLLMFRLRFDFAHRYGGWVPLIAKNRPITTAEGEINGGGKINGGGEINGGGGGPFILDGCKPLINGRKKSGADVTICVLDTDVYNHPEFVGRNVEGLAEGAGPEDGPPMAGHGTFGVGLILEQAPAATIKCRRVLEPDGGADLWDVARQIMALESAGELDADILHMPWGCLTRDGKAPYLLEATITKIARADRVMVAAAGNHGDCVDREVPRNAPCYPAALSRVVSAGAEGPLGELTDFTPKPRSAPWIDYAGGGYRVHSTYLRDRCAKWSGTSFSAARYTGLLAAEKRPGAGPDARGKSIGEIARRLAGDWRRRYDEHYG